MAKSTLFEGVTGGTIKDTDVMAYKEEGIVVGDPKRIHFFSAMKTYFQGLLPSRITQNEDDITEITDSLSPVDIPSVGDAILPGDRILLDGVNTSGSTSDGIKPDTFDNLFLPAKTLINGRSTSEPANKFTNKGSYGFYKELTNLIGTGAATESFELQDGTGVEPTKVEHKEWTRLISNKTDGWSKIKWTEPTGHASGGLPMYTSVDVMTAGGSWPSTIIEVLSGATVKQTVTITWNTSIVSTDEPNNFSYFVDEDKTIARIQLRSTGEMLEGNTLSIQITDTAFAGAGIFYRNPMLINECYFAPVPYFETVSPIADTSYTFNTAQAISFTLQGWIYYFNDPTATQYRTILSGGKNEVDQLVGDTGFELYTDSGSLYLLKETSGTPVLIQASITEGWHHFSITSDPFLGSGSIKVFVDGVEELSEDIQILIFGYDNPFMIGNNLDKDRPADMMMTDLVIKDYYDISTDHYTNSLPYYDPNTIYGTDGRYKLDKNGNMVCNDIATNTVQTNSIDIENNATIKWNPTTQSIDFIIK